MRQLTNEFQPKLVGALKTYSLSKFVSDLIAGITVGLVALPLAMAFAISSGVPPQSGIYCAIFAGFLISALGGSLVQIGGPTGAFVVVVSGIVHKHGIDGLYMCTLMAGIFLCILGLTGLGTSVKFIPRPVIIGFTNGIAVLIASTQIKDFFGLKTGPVPGDFLGRCEVLISNASTFQVTTLILSVGCLVLIIAFQKFVKRVPGTIVALILGTTLATLLKLPVETIETKFHGIPSALPSLNIPHFRPDLILTLLPSAVTVTMLGAIESLLSAVVADRLSADKHNPNVELFAQGVANIVSPLFGGLPATGAIARTATNVRSGAKSPLSGMIHAITLLLILLFASSYAKLIPLSVLAAILFVVSYNMGEWKEIPETIKVSRADAAVWALTFALTVLADLTVAVEVGMILAALLYINRVTATTKVERITDSYIDEGRTHSLQVHGLPKGVAAYRIHGPFLFGATDKLNVILDDLPTLPKVVMLRIRNMSALDGTGLKAIENISTELKKSGRTLILCGALDQPGKLLEKGELADKIGRENFQPSLELAIKRAKSLLDAEI